MRKLILVCSVAFCTVLTAFTMQSKTKVVAEDNVVCNYGQCSKIKDDGYRCKNCCQQNSSYCWSHR